MAVANKKTPPPAYRIFISSTYIDMVSYREALHNTGDGSLCCEK